MVNTVSLVREFEAFKGKSVFPSEYWEWMERAATCLSSQTTERTTGADSAEILSDERSTSVGLRDKPPSSSSCAQCAELAQQPPATRYFNMIGAEYELDDALLRAFGADPEQPGTGNWPAPDFGYDDYGGSFELWNTRNDFDPTEEQLQAVWALGFGHGWICYADGTEIHVHQKGRSDRHASRHGQSDEKRMERQYRRHVAELAQQRNFQRERADKWVGISEKRSLEIETLEQQIEQLQKELDSEKLRADAFFRGREMVKAALDETKSALFRRADEIVQAVAELPDRTSPDDWPEAMLVTANELRHIVTQTAQCERERATQHEEDEMAEQEIGEMHWREGWMFTRLQNGSVRIRLNDGIEASSDAIPTAIIPAAEWVSIVHHLAAEQTAESMKQATTLHVCERERAEKGQK